MVDGPEAKARETIDKLLTAAGWPGQIKAIRGLGAVGRNDIQRLSTGNQESMRNIGQDRIKQIRIPLPPLSEMGRISAEVERRLSVIDELEIQVEANLKRAERLRQAILKRAFEGKLVPQDPDDEPATVLLERIPAERAQRVAEAGRAKKRTGRSACAT